MKKVVIYLFCGLCSINCSAKNNDNIKIIINRIDLLVNTADVVVFVKSIDSKFAGKNFGNLEIKQTDSIYNDLGKCPLTKEWQINNWEKVDLNNDGKTDLLFTAYWYSTYSQYAIIAKEKNSFQLNELSDNIQYGCKLVKPIKIDGKNELLLHDFKRDADHVKMDTSTYFEDTLTYKFDSFIEKHSEKQTNYEIESVVFLFQNLFQLEVNNLGVAKYEIIQDPFLAFGYYGDLYNGKATKNITRNKFEELSDLLEYIRVKDLADDYEINGVDFSTVVLEVRFKDGTIKKIRDYGFQGTFGLNSVYQKMIKIAKEIKL
ncbi:hypothetical protein AB3G34_12700 [Flavobacterium sp. WC2409]|uniref:DUF6438 domain-containing protein n=1 Tax=Flavobacterium sp. WC2409 TaxID=3234139 RepID=A0AB39W105_9FLAO